MSHYQTRIAELAPGQDARLIEAWMRVDLGTLDHLDPRRFAQEVGIAIICIREAGEDTAEAVAVAMGMPKPAPHMHVGVGQCPFCKHYGDDCTGDRVWTPETARRRVSGTWGT